VAFKDIDAMAIGRASSAKRGKKIEYALRSLGSLPRFGSFGLSARGEP
jgi:hypothetical protein